MNQLQHIRSLIRRYYQGTSTPAEFDEIVAYFAATDPVDDDLLTEKALFMALGELAETQPEVPQSLRRSLESIGVEPERRAPRRRFLLLHIVSYAAAVAAIVLLCLSVRVFFSPNAGTDAAVVADRTGQRPADTTTSSPATRSDSLPAHTVERVALPVENAAPTRRGPVVKRQKARRARPETTDERERRGALRTVELLNRSLSKADIACTDVEESFQEIDNTLNNLQK